MKKQATQILAVLAIILIIWFVVPLIAINQIQLLPSTTDRLLAICVLLIVGICFLLLKKPWQQTNAQNPTTENQFSLWSFINNSFALLIEWIKTKKEQSQKLLTEIEQGPYVEANLILAKHFKLVREYCDKYNEKKKIPTYLLIGHQFSGKTSLVKKSNLTFKTIPIVNPQDYLDLDHPNELKNCLWHIHNDCIFIDTPGDYANSEVNNEVQTPWRSLINLLLKKYQKFPIKGLIITISVHELISTSQKTAKLHLHLLKQRIIELKKYYGEKIPLYIIFTKCDAVIGFSEFFENLSAEERKYPFTIKFNKNFAEQSVLSQFKQQYELLLQQMSHLLIIRMHQEHNPKKRALISQFPLQMEQLQVVLGNIIKQLMEKTHDADCSNPNAIFFSSAEHTNDTIDVLYHKLQTSFNLAEKQLVINNPSYSKDYFIQGIFQDFINCNVPAPTELVISRKMQFGIYSLSAAFVVAFGVFTLYKFITDLKNLTDLETNAYSLVQSNSNVRKTATNKNQILAMTEQVNKASDFWFTENSTSNLASNKNVKVDISAKQNSASNPNLSKAMQNYLENILGKKTTTPDKLYSALKAYLMMGQTGHLQYEWLTHWLEENAVKNHIITGDQIQSILNSMQQQQILYTAQAAVITSARNQLTNLPKQYLAFVILQSKANNAGASLSITIANKKIYIPFLFTAQGLQTIFLNSMNSAINIALHGNWLLGKLNSSGVSAADIQQQVIAMYSANYASWWSKVFYGIQLPSFTDIPSLAHYVALLNDPNVGVINAYNTILQNTNVNIIFPEPVKNTLIQNIRNSLSDQINGALSNLILLNLADVEAALNQFSQFMTNLANSDDIPNSAFLVFKNQFQNPSQPNILTGFGTFAATLPDPLNTTFSNLANQCQQLTAQAALFYLQNAWDTQIVQYYNKHLAQRYPLYSDSVEDISLHAFTKFFAPNGLLQQFYQNNLSMFIDSSNSAWQWQNIDGLSLQLNNDLLLAIEKARIITTMFFPDGSNKISVPFTLQQVETMPIVQTFSLNINGQSLSDPQGTRNISSFIWPGNSGNLGTQVSFVDVNGQHVETERQGAWSWFRMIDLNSIRQDGSSQDYNLTFDVDGNEARYHLTANGPINPFISGIINSFRLPEKIS